MLAGPDRPLVPAALCCCSVASKRSAHVWIFMRQAVLSLLLACEPEQGFFDSGGFVRFLRSRSFQKSFAEAMVFLFVCAVPGWKRSVPERPCHWRFPWLRQWRQWRRAEVTGAGGTGRKLVLCWRSCTQGRHAGGNCRAGRSEGGSPLSRDGALLYSRAPGGVLIGVSFQVEGGSPLSILPCGFGGNCYQ